MSEGSNFQGLEIELQRHSGARVLRVVHPGAQQIGEHRHDWAYIGLFVTGRYREEYDGGEAEMAGPCAVLHPAGRPHADAIAGDGLETLTIEFERAWLRHHGFDKALDQSRIWSGGAIAGHARRLARVAGQGSDEAALGAATGDFLRAAFKAIAPAPPRWLPKLELAVAMERNSTLEIARRLDLHPAFMARAYRAATGEGLGAMRRRRRVEQACGLLRRSSLPLAEVAAIAGFCDQSHMNRAFRAVLGRTPLAVRGERF